MTVLLYIFAGIGIIVTVAGIIGLGIDLSQSRDDMAYWIHMRFPEFEKEIEAKLYAFEEKLKKPAEDGVYALKEEYSCDMRYLVNRLDNHENRLDNHEKVFVTRKDYIQQTEELVQRCDDNALLFGRIDDLDAVIKSMRKDIDMMKKNAVFNIKNIEERLQFIERSENYIHKPPYKITVGDDPDQMSSGTAVES